MSHLSSFFAHDRLQALIHSNSSILASHAGLMFADISGFTALTKEMVDAYQARRGTETLIDNLNHYYTNLIAKIREYNGSIIYFAGDALTCSFGKSTDALLCAVALQAALENADISLKVSLSYGNVQRYLFGNTPTFDVPLGDAVNALNILNPHAHAGDIVVTQAFADTLPKDIQTKLVPTPATSDILRIKSESYISLQATDNCTSDLTNNFTENVTKKETITTIKTSISVITTDTSSIATSCTAKTGNHIPTAQMPTVAIHEKKT